MEIHDVKAVAGGQLQEMDVACITNVLPLKVHGHVHASLAAQRCQVLQHRNKLCVGGDHINAIQVVRRHGYSCC